MKSLKEYVYSESGRAINARMNEAHLRANGYSAMVDQLLDATSNFSDMSFTERLRMFVFDKIRDNVCETCKVSLRIWEGAAWKRFCCRKCAQNSPETKRKVKDSQSNVDWQSVINKRSAKMQEKYGVDAYSQLDVAKTALAERNRVAWADDTQKHERLAARTATNISRYGVEHTSQRDEQRIISGKKISSSYASKDVDTKKRIREEYRRTRLSLEAHAMLVDKSTMFDLYMTQRKTILGISREIGCAESSVVYALEQHGIDYDPSRHSVVSDRERELYEFVKTLAPTAISTYKDGKHIDIFIPEKKLGFEFNGVYWHSEARCAPDYHMNKVEYFYNRGIRYVQIWEDDWLNRPDVVKRFIKNLLGQNNRIGARQTIVTEITQLEFDAFMNENHMQGTVFAGRRLGLVFNGAIVSAMGFRDVASSNMRHTELVRFANTNVTGAFTKMLAYFEKTSPTYESIKSFADLELVDKRKNVYSSNGFDEVEFIYPTYKYLNPKTGIREHKFGYRKSAFERMGMDIHNKTERQLAVECGLLRCYDSGKIKYVKTIGKLG